jgi:transposase
VLNSVSYPCGIDVSKDSLDVHLLPEGRAWKLPNSESAHQELVEQLSSLDGKAKVVVEATGGYERRVVAALVAAKISVIVVNPRQARRFAESMAANPAKSDPADARSLAHMAASLPLEERTIPDKAQQELAELVSRRRQLVEMLACEKNRLAQAICTKVRQDVQATIDWLNTRLSKLDEELDQRIECVEELKLKGELLQQEKGVGRTTARILLACLPELGSLDRQSIATLAGVAPLRNDSGKINRPRHVRGGRREVRNALWMATFTARRCNDKIRPMYERLINAGKPYKVAMVACMRKLLTILNATLRRHSGHPQTPKLPSLSVPC